MANTPNLAGKTALVTGASRGIGRALALELAKAGAHILAIARTAGGLEDLDDEIREAGGSASLVPIDLIEGDGIEQMAGALQPRFPKIDILLACAADIGELAPLTDIAPKAWTRTMDLNVTANWRLLRALDPMLQSSTDARVIFLTSRVGGELARSFWGAYAVSKAALEMLAETYAQEMANTNVSTAIIDPGAMRTGMRATAMPGEDPMSLPHPSELAPMLFELLAANPEPYRRMVFRDWNSKNA